MPPAHLLLEVTGQPFQLDGQTVLITGATGFVGSHLVERLLADGARVRVLVRAASKANRLAERGAEIVEGDLTDIDSLRRAVHGCALVFSVAAWTGRSGGYAMAVRVNVDGIRALVEAALAAGVRRIVHTSSIAAYGYCRDGVVTEDWPLRGADAYGETKARSEEIVLSYADRIEASVLRPAQVFGPRGGTWTATLFDAVKRGLPILIDGGGGNFHPCYIDNLVDAYLLAASQPEAVGEAFTIVDGTTTWREFIGYYTRMTGRAARSIPGWPLRLALRAIGAWSRLTRRPSIATPGAIDFLTGQVHYSNEKARRLLDWSPRVPLDEAMRRTESWLRETARLT